MSADTQKRSEDRIDSSPKLALIKCRLVVRGEPIEIEVVNFHHRGACLRVAVGDYRLQTPETHLSFSIGLKTLDEKILFRLVWETISEDGLFGVEFQPQSSFVLERAQRFLVNQINAPVISSQDPLDPNRVLYFRVVNASSTGLGLVTSLSNKHLFPGMELRAATMEIPGIGQTELGLYIENSRLTTDGTNEQLQIGVSIRANAGNYSALMAKYLSNLGESTHEDERLEQLHAAGFVQRELSKHLSLKEVRTEADYEKVLKLRFQGYSAVGKVADGKTWRDMGEGLNNEGLVLAASLGGQVVASAEIRLHRKHPVKLAEKFDITKLPGIKGDNLVEVNKLVIHTKAQGTDVVLGMFQKIHAIGMLNGTPDFLCASEPKLIPLYERLGFKRTELTYPHPVKTGITLTLMVLPHEIYSDAQNMNPFAWTMVYGVNSRHLDDLGIYEAPRFSRVRRAHLRASEALFKWKEKRKKGGGRRKTDAPDRGRHEVAGPQSADPRWTKMHMNATVMWPYLLESKAMIGEKETLTILYDFHLDFDYFKSSANWISIEFFDEFIARFSQFGDPYALNRRAGLLNVSPEILGSNYYLVKHCLTPGLLFKSFEGSVQKFNKTRSLRILESGPGFCRIRITNPDRTLLPKHPSAKENWYAVCEAIVLGATGRPAQIEKLRSAFDGDDYCEFIVRWQNPFRARRKMFMTTVAGVLLTALLVKFFNTFTPAQIAVAALAFATVGLIPYFAFRSRTEGRKYKEIVESLRVFEKQTDERYRELQNSKLILEKSYQEGRILEDIHREIQTSDDLSNILQTALGSLCGKFEFKRAFAMIHDASTNTLRTSAVAGLENAATDVWKFSVDVSKSRESAMVLSSVYHSGQSILISDIDEHKFHLNEMSRQLVDRLETNGFAIVPIPSQNRNWGVICADKGRSRDVITRRDLVALQRIAQSLGLALDKKAKIEAEIRARKIFQKFVPSTVVESVLGETGPTLGGQSKEVVCLFLDIRDFTALSNRLPSEILVDVLNQIFEVVQQNVAASGAVIDKFIGDGVLVHWGAIPGSEPDPLRALNTARQILNDLFVLNQKFIARALDAVEVGIGLHRGKVTVGNIGSQDRMEFTIVGAEVNFASRLEGLNKVYQSNIVVSESLIDFASLSSEWVVHSDVQIRGVERKVKIAAYTFRPSPTHIVDVANAEPAPLRDEVIVTEDQSQRGVA